MKILFLSAEVAPYVAVGGLSQVLHYLPRALTKRGHDVRIFTAKYGAMKEKSPDRETWSLRTDIENLAVPVENSPKKGDNGTVANFVNRKNESDAIEYGGAVVGQPENPAKKAINCSVISLQPKKNDPRAYFLDNKEYFAMRANVFGYSDDHTRFALLSKGALEWLKTQYDLRASGDDRVWLPEIIHCHDWHTSYFIDLARHDERYREMLADIPIVLTVHNFKYQGNGNFRYVPEADSDSGVSPLLGLTDSNLQKQNALKRGLLYADAITTVSPTHAIEVLTPEYAEGLDSTIAGIRGKLSGILNGLDTKEFNPSTDKAINRRFDGRYWKTSRAENKKYLQQFFSLPVDATKPMFAYVGRLTAQKGLDLLAESLRPLLTEQPEAQVVFLGGGDEKYRTELETLRNDFPSQVGLYLQPDFTLSRKIFSGTDILLMPSIFEPGGIVALEGLRYGAVPLVRRTGGLNDSITKFDANKKTGNGFSFIRKNSWSLYGAMIEALAIYRQKALWEKLVGNCLACDFSWEHSAAEYEEWYRQAVQEHSSISRWASKPTE